MDVHSCRATEGSVESSPLILGVEPVYWTHIGGEEKEHVVFGGSQADANAIGVVNFLNICFYIISWVVYRGRFKMGLCVRRSISSFLRELSTTIGNPCRVWFRRL